MFQRKRDNFLESNRGARFWFRFQLAEQRTRVDESDGVPQLFVPEIQSAGSMTMTSTCRSSNSSDEKIDIWSDEIPEELRDAVSACTVPFLCFN